MHEGEMTARPRRCSGSRASVRRGCGPGRPQTAEGAAAGVGAGDVTESVEQPAKVMRIGSMIKQLLDEVRHAPLDEASRTRLREIYEHRSGSWPTASRPTSPPSSTAWRCPSTTTVPTEAELRIAQAQLVGLARRALPRHPGDAVRPADGGPGPARADAPAGPPRAGPTGRPRRAYPAAAGRDRVPLSGCTPNLARRVRRPRARRSAPSSESQPV